MAREWRLKGQGLGNGNMCMRPRAHTHDEGHGRVWDTSSKLSHFLTLVRVIHTCHMSQVMMDDDRDVIVIHPSSFAAATMVVTGHYCLAKF